MSAPHHASASACESVSSLQRAGHDVERGEPLLAKPRVHELRELLRRLVVVAVARREEARDAGVVVADQLAELAAEAAHELPLARVEAQPVAAVGKRGDRRAQPHQSCWSVAQRPWAWRRAASYSARSRVPVDTAAFPSLCTCHISFSAFSFG